MLLRRWGLAREMSKKGFQTVEARGLVLLSLPLLAGLVAGLAWQARQGGCSLLLHFLVAAAADLDRKGKLTDDRKKYGKRSQVKDEELNDGKPRVFVELFWQAARFIRTGVKP